VTEDPGPVPGPPGRALGLDLGTRRIGVALSDSDRTVATPLEVIDRSDKQRAHRRIASLIDEWEITTVVVGLPLHLSGHSGSSVEFVESEIAALGATIDTPLVTYDERLTTVSAHRSLDDQQVPAKNRRDLVDMVAAAVILQNWMDSSTNG